MARFVKEGDQWARKVAPVPMVSLVIRCGEDKEPLRACIESLVEWTSLPLEIALVGKVNTGDAFRALKGRTRFTVARSLDLRSISEAAGLKGEYVVFMDAPALVTQGWLEGLLKCLEWHPVVGAAEPSSRGNNWRRQGDRLVRLADGRATEKAQ